MLAGTVGNSRRGQSIERTDDSGIAAFHKKRSSDKQRGHIRRHDGLTDRWDAMSKAEQQAGGSSLRNVWKIATQGFSAAHFATFPPKLVIPCIQAGTSEKGVCSECGAPWVRQTSTSYVKSPGHGKGSITGRRDGGDEKTGYGGMPRVSRHDQTTGWLPSCSCDAPTQPATVLDPFAGAGTVGLVADRLGRDSVLIEISQEYAEMARERIHGSNPMFSGVTIE